MASHENTLLRDTWAHVDDSIAYRVIGEEGGKPLLILKNIDRNFLVWGLVPRFALA